MNIELSEDKLNSLIEEEIRRYVKAESRELWIMVKPIGFLNKTSRI
jgi:hypothetical protein